MLKGRERERERGEEKGTQPSRNATKAAQHEENRMNDELRSEDGSEKRVVAVAAAAAADLDSQDRQPGNPVPATMGQMVFAITFRSTALRLWFFRGNFRSSVRPEHESRGGAGAGRGRVCSPSRGVSASDSTSCPPRLGSASSGLAAS